MSRREQPTSPFNRSVAMLVCMVLVVCAAVFDGRMPLSFDDLFTSLNMVEQGTTDTSEDERDAPSQSQDAQGKRDTSSQNEDANSQNATTDGATSHADDGTDSVAPTRGPTIDEDGSYTSKDEVALYIHTYGHLPSNFITKFEARAQGWVASKGNLNKVCPGMSIGGDRFGNNEGRLPDARGRRWTECDINYQRGKRGAERIVFSSDGLVYYTKDHYRSFERIY